MPPWWPPGGGGASMVVLAGAVAFNLVAAFVTRKTTTYLTGLLVWAVCLMPFAGTPDQAAGYIASYIVVWVAGGAVGQLIQAGSS